MADLKENSPNSKIALQDTNVMNAPKFIEDSAKRHRNNYQYDNSTLCGIVQAETASTKSANNNVRVTGVVQDFSMSCILYHLKNVPSSSQTSDSDRQRDACVV